MRRVERLCSSVHAFVCVVLAWATRNTAELHSAVLRCPRFHSPVRVSAAHVVARALGCALRLRSPHARSSSGMDGDRTTTTRSSWTTPPCVDDVPVCSPSITDYFVATSAVFITVVSSDPSPTCYPIHRGVSLPHCHLPSCTRCTAHPVHLPCPLAAPPRAPLWQKQRLRLPMPSTALLTPPPPAIRRLPLPLPLPLPPSPTTALPPPTT